MEKRSRSRGSIKDIGRGSESRRSTSNRHSRGRRSRERWEERERMRTGLKGGTKEARCLKVFSRSEEDRKIAAVCGKRKGKSDRNGGINVQGGNIWKRFAK